MTWVPSHSGHIVTSIPTQCWTQCTHGSSPGAFESSKPQKGTRLLAPNFPCGNCILSLSFVYFDKMHGLGPGCHYSSLIFFLILLLCLPKGEPCVMGERKIYKKRKPGAQCSLGRDYSRTVVSEPCVCGQGDFEWWVCDSGKFCRASSCSIGSGWATVLDKKMCGETGSYAASRLWVYNIAQVWSSYL